MDELTVIAPSRGDLTPARLKEHIHTTVKRLENLGISRGDSLASLLPEGPDAMTARLALAAFPHARFVPIDTGASPEQFASLLVGINPKLLLKHPGDHPATQVARSLGIPIANVLRHFEAGVFTLESATPLRSSRPAHAVPSPKGTSLRSRSTPLVLIAPGLAYRRLAKRLDATNPVIGITPPSLEHLPLPHTIQHVAAECVRMLRRYRRHGPYAFAGWQSEGLVALEMARLLENEGEHVAFVALLDASDLFFPPSGSIRRLLVPIRRFLGRKSTPSFQFMAEALRHYRPHPWYGRILHIRRADEAESRSGHPWFEWHDIAPHGLVSFEAPAEMLAEPHVQTVAGILASELDQSDSLAGRVGQAVPPVG